MAYEPKDGSGALFVNYKKEEGSNQPDYNGSIHLDGKEYWLSGWRKKTKDGKGYLSVAVGQEKTKAGAGKGPSRGRPSNEFPC